MNIKRVFSTVSLLAAVVATIVGCKSEETLYSGPEYVMFADTINYYPVTNDAKSVFDVTVATTKSTDYDRTFGVEIVDKGSTAIEDVHYNLLSNSITIKAGERTAQVEVAGHYDNLDRADSLGFNLRLVASDNVKWEMYGDQTSVVLYKACPFSIDDMVSASNPDNGVDEEGNWYGNFVVYCTFPFDTSSWSTLLVKGYKLDDNRIVFKDVFADGYDLKMRFNNDDPLEPSVEVLPQDSFFTESYGIIKMKSDDSYQSFYSPCYKFTTVYMTGFLDGLGSFGTYLYYFEWISEADAQYRKRQ